MLPAKQIRLIAVWTVVSDLGLPRGVHSKVFLQLR
jgi:hypothetical protein